MMTIIILVVIFVCYIAASRRGVDGVQRSISPRTFASRMARGVPTSAERHMMLRQCHEKTWPEGKTAALDFFHLAKAAAV
jgi:hypothetical protein